MAEKYLLVQWPDGKTGAVLPDRFSDKDMAAYFKDARIISYEDGSEYDGPVTAGGMVRKEEREAEAQEEKPAPRRAAAKE